MPTIIKFISKILEPSRVFIAIMLAVLIWLIPAILQPTPSNTEKIWKPIQPYGGIGIVSAIEANAPNCSRECQIVVCTHWIAGPTIPPDRRCLNPGPGGGCCLDDEVQCDPGCSDPTPTLPPIISGILNCSQTGNNDWCIGSLTLDLSASDPQNAQIIISGDVNGVAFACPAGNTTCSVSIPDGQGTINYRVDSFTTLSATVSTTYKKDSTTPQVNGSIIGSSGSNDWYITSTILSATSNDVTSGINGFEMNVDNTGWVTYDETTFTDGIYTIQYRATDNAGNITETTQQEIKVDTVTPTINTSITGTNGLDNWYTSSVSVTSTATDLTSGVASLEMNINNAGWETYSATTLTDGIHTIQYRAEDYAGNTFETTQQTIKIDATTPSLNLSTIGTIGQNNWFVSAVSITPTATDTTSGILKIETSVNNGIYSKYTTPLQFTDGVHTYQIKVTDNAGNITQTPLQTIQVDTIAPAIDMTTELDLGDRLYYSLEDSGSGLWINRTVIEDEDERYQKIVWLEEIAGNKVKGDILWDGKFKDGASAPVGEYFITLKISDRAGNETFQMAIVDVNLLSFLQIIPAFTLPTTTNDITSQLDNQSTNEQSFGGENNANEGSETNTISNGGENVLQGLIAQSSAFTSGNESTTTSIPTSNILWGAMATAVLGYTVAEWQKQREEEERKRKEAEAEMWREKNQARKEKEAEYLQGLAIAEAKEEAEKQYLHRYNAHMVDKMEQFETIDDAKWTASQAVMAQREKEKEQAAFDHLMGEHEDISTPSSNIFQQLSVGVTSLFDNLSSGWDNFVTKITQPSTQTGPLFGSGESFAMINSFDYLLDGLLFDGQINKATVAVKEYLESIPVYNVINNVGSFATGATLEYINDVSVGLFGKIWDINWENGDEFFQAGRGVGQSISTVQGVAEIIVGTALFIDGGIKFIGGNIGKGACLVTGPGVVICYPVAKAIEMVGVGEMAGGLVLGGHGAGILWNNANTPLQIRGNGSSSGNDAYNIAKSGGKHSGTYILYKLKPTKSIKSALKSYEAVIQEHYDKLANPSRWVSNWNDLPEWRQEKYFNGWRDDIARNQELADIMKGILQERGDLP